MAAAVAAIGAVRVATIQRQKFQEGGIVPGTSLGRDSVPAMLEPGELVIDRETTERLLAGDIGQEILVSVEMGPNLTHLADELNVAVRGGNARLIATELAGSRTVR
jgi:hypothetical protein